ncbi:MAG: hypothetical protein WC155_08785 [Candidatus Cloacimonadales bacterium]|nr:hypothetical protein [Methanolobus sp.]
MELEAILKEWEDEVSDLYKLLQENEEEKKAINRKLKESQLGEQRLELTQRIKKIKNLIEQRRFEISGLKKAEQRIKGNVKVKRQLTIGAS